MRELLRNYLMLIAATALTWVESVSPRFPAFAEPWLSLLSLGLLVFVAVRLGRADARRRDAQELPHARRLRRVMLLFVSAGVLTCLHWLVYFKQLRYGPLDQHQVLGGATAAISLAAVGDLLYGLAVILRQQWRARPRRPRPAPPA